MNDDLGLVIKDNKVAVCSRDVARVFEREHKVVLKAIRELGCSDEFNRHNFMPVDYVDAKGEKRPEYLLTRDGFVLLAMGFTGKGRLFLYNLLKDAGVLPVMEWE